MKLLALDTATEACSAALSIDGEIIQRYQIAPRKHSSLLLPMVDELINEAGIAKSDLDIIAFGRGPGSFMGVRIATGVAQGIAYALALPVVPVSTLSAIAKVCFDKSGVDRVACAIDARMEEVYWACFQMSDEGLPVLVDEEKVLPPHQIILPEDSKWLGAGTGWASYQDAMKQSAGESLLSIQDEILPSASAIAEIALEQAKKGITVSAEMAIPVYLRNKVARTTIERQQSNVST